MISMNNGGLQEENPVAMAILAPDYCFKKDLTAMLS